MSRIQEAADEGVAAQESGWRDLWLKEDWWAVWLGLGLVIAAFALFVAGSSIAWIAVAPAKWSTFSELILQLAANAPRYFAQCGLFLALC
jgi:Sec-independent protein secretion pathway component TatC